MDTCDMRTGRAYGGLQPDGTRKEVEASEGEG